MTDNKRIGVVLLNLGGPDSADAVQPFLYNLFSDPDIINFPLSFLFRKRLAKLISTKRAPKIIDQYSHIGGKSPILELTTKQANALQKVLDEKIESKVYIAMRYWKPFTEDVIHQIIKDKIDEVILLPLYPQFSVSTTGSSVNEWTKVKSKYKELKDLKVELIETYYTNPVYIDSIIENINQTIKRFPGERQKDVFLLFSAHGTPVKLVKMGDPYQKHIIETVEEVMKRGGYKQNHFLSYQSKVGPQKWLEPKTPDTIERLASEGVKDMLVIPIAFVSDHLETLFEIGIEFRHLAKEKGIEQFEVMPGLNDSPKFISALAKLVLERVNGKN
ncbi:MAG: ferrochelatase [Ignavibacteriae bacterium]|nr:MAG: ferrochelatase [Ignavibacteriota bacterium]